MNPPATPALLSPAATGLATPRCRLLELPMETLDHIINNVRLADERFRQDKAKYDRIGELNLFEARVDLFSALERDNRNRTRHKWAGAYGKGLASLSGSCKVLRKIILPHLFNTLRLSRTTHTEYLTKFQFLLPSHIKTVELDTYGEDGVLEDMEDALRAFLIQLLNFHRLDRLTFTSGDTLIDLRKTLPLPDEPPKSGLRAYYRHETMQIVSQHLARQIKSLEYVDTMAGGLEHYLQFPSITSLSFIRSIGQESIEDCGAFAKEAIHFTKLESLTLDLRRPHFMLDLEDDELPECFFDDILGEFPWSSAQTLTRLSFAKITFSDGDYFFATSFPNLQSLHLTVEIVDPIPIRKRRPLLRLSNLSISDATDRGTWILLTAFTGSPLRTVFLALQPHTNVRACQEIYHSVLKLSDAGVKFSFRFDGRELCVCHWIMGSLPRLDIKLDSDKMWRRVASGQGAAEPSCPVDPHMVLRKEVRDALEFGLSKLDQCEKMGDGDGVRELARWLVTLRGRKLLEEY